MAYTDKIITARQAVDLVQSGDYIVTGLGCATADAFLSHLHLAAGRVDNVLITTCLVLRDYPCFNDPAYAGSFLHDSWFYGSATRRAHELGSTSFVPSNLHFAATKRLAHRRPNWFVCPASMPDRHGYVSTSLSNVYEMQMLEAADRVILEINPNYPRPFGDHHLPLSRADYVIEADYTVPVLPDVPSSDKDILIGNLVAEHIQDGDCLQLGIGGVPNAIAQALHTKKDLGIHTEMLTTGMMGLYQAGAVTGLRKQINRGRMTCAFVMGTPELYDFVHDNPGVEVVAARYTNDPFVIAQNDNMVSVNATMEIDLTGQCASESLGSRHFSGTGGQTDTAVGAQKSKNGRSFICLYATAHVKNPETGERKEISRIVPQLKPGAAVTLSRNDVDHVVTEYGVARLRGTNLRERVERLIAIAHPRFREELTRQAWELGIVSKR